MNKDKQLNIKLTKQREIIPNCSLHVQNPMKVLSCTYTLKWSGHQLLDCRTTMATDTSRYWSSIPGTH